MSIMRFPNVSIPSRFNLRTAPMSGALCLLVLPLAAQIGPPPKEGPSKPTPRLADGHPDLGNGKGSWYPRIVDDISGNGGGEKDASTRKRQMSMVDKRIDVPFQPWAKA